jgi:allophanate hydrolase
MSVIQSLLMSELRAGYAIRRFTPRDVIDEVLARIEREPERNVWITRLTRGQMLTYADALLDRDPATLPLYGVPFAIKDNIDLADVRTTAACEAFAYVPARSATVVERLLAAGAIPVGKTNLDQFATGLVGTRSPHGACRNSFNDDFISGGSSSGSAVAVATGLVSFALGTDTAGSGRVPAAFNNLIGLKPSCGLVSTRGVVPACRSLDCVAIFALTTGDAARVLDVAAAFDREDEYSRDFAGSNSTSLAATTAHRVGIPRAGQLEFFGNADYRALFTRSCEQAKTLGWEVREIDFEPFLATARLLYEGPWVAERYAAIASLIETHPDALHEVTRSIIAGGSKPSAVEAFRAQYRLKQLQRQTADVWRDVDFLLTPTAPTIHTIAAVLADPVRLNSQLGYYTNFVNLLDLAAVAVPTGFGPAGVPGGVTLIGRAGQDRALLHHASRLHRAARVKLGALDLSLPMDEPPQALASDSLNIVVCGAHMSGLPLNHQLVERSGSFVRATRTAPRYRFFALAGEPPKRPGLVRVSENGAAIEVEVWSLPLAHVGGFLAGIPAPLGLGKVELEDGSQCTGFICETAGTSGAEDITHFGGWRGYLRR